MTEADKERIERAEKLSCIEWGTAYKLAEEADTEEAKKELNWIGNRKYREEEYSAGLL